jgi:transcriptional regulator
MYVPPSFAADHDTALAVIEQHGFATVVTTGDDGPSASHLPLVLDRARGRLVGHLARANPQWRDLERGPVLAIFHGPHAYVSPTWYAPRPDAVPTWNYVAVHVRGRARLLGEGADSIAALELLTARHEPAGYPLDADAVAKLSRAIVGFTLDLDEVTAKLKLSQNRSDADHASVVAHLAASDDAGARAVAAWMQARRR